MSDLIERLRNVWCQANCYDVRKEADDEIERLRDRSKEWEERARAMLETVKLRDAEIDRLRAAMRECWNMLEHECSPASVQRRITASLE